MTKLEKIITNHFNDIVNKCTINNFQKCIDLIHKLMKKVNTKINSYNILVNVYAANKNSCDLCISLCWVDTNNQFYIKNIIKNI